MFLNIILKDSFLIGENINNAIQFEHNGKYLYLFKDIDDCCDITNDIDIQYSIADFKFIRLSSSKNNTKATIIISEKSFNYLMDIWESRRKEHNSYRKYFEEYSNQKLGDIVIWDDIEDITVKNIESFLLKERIFTKWDRLHLP